MYWGFYSSCCSLNNYFNAVLQASPEDLRDLVKFWTGWEVPSEVMHVELTSGRLPTAETWQQVPAILQAGQGPDNLLSKVGPRIERQDTKYCALLMWLSTSQFVYGEFVIFVLCFHLFLYIVISISFCIFNELDIGYCFHWLLNAIYQLWTKY